MKSIFFCSLNPLSIRQLSLATGPSFVSPRDHDVMNRIQVVPLLNLRSSVVFDVKVISFMSVLG